MTEAQGEKLKLLAEAYLRLLKLTRGGFAGVGTDAALANLRDEIATLYKADAEYVQNSFELVADTMRQ